MLEKVWLLVSEMEREVREGWILGRDRRAEEEEIRRVEKAVVENARREAWRNNM